MPLLRGVDPRCIGGRRGIAGGGCGGGGCDDDTIRIAVSIPFLAMLAMLFVTATGGASGGLGLTASAIPGGFLTAGAARLRSLSFVAFVVSVASFVLSTAAFVVLLSVASFVLSTAAFVVSVASFVLSTAAFVVFLSVASFVLSTAAFVVSVASFVLSTAALVWSVADLFAFSTRTEVALPSSTSTGVSPDCGRRRITTAYRNRRSATPPEPEARAISHVCHALGSVDAGGEKGGGGEEDDDASDASPISIMDARISRNVANLWYMIVFFLFLTGVRSREGCVEATKQIFFRDTFLVCFFYDDVISTQMTSPQSCICGEHGNLLAWSAVVLLVPAYLAFLRIRFLSFDKDQQPLLFFPTTPSHRHPVCSLLIVRVVPFVSLQARTPRGRDPRTFAHPCGVEQPRSGPVGIPWVLHHLVHHFGALHSRRP